jgi:hypothetical protein
LATSDTEAEDQQNHGEELGIECTRATASSTASSTAKRIPVKSDGAVPVIDSQPIGVRARGEGRVHDSEHCLSRHIGMTQPEDMTILMQHDTPKIQDRIAAAVDLNRAVSLRQRFPNENP